VLISDQGNTFLECERGQLWKGEENMTILTSKLACKYFGGKKVFKRYFFFGKRVRNSQPLIEITPNPAHCIALHCIALH
jgi:hypothetical protein